MPLEDPAQSWLGQRSQPHARLHQLGGCQMTWYKCRSVAMKNGWILKVFYVASSVVDTEVTLEAVRSHCAGAVQMRSQY